MSTNGMQGFSAGQNESPASYPYNGKILLAAVISLSVVVSFVVILHVYARWFLRRRSVTVLVVREPPRPRSTPAFPGRAVGVTLPGDGVDAKVVASLPVFVYKSAEHENGLDCVVCLSVMEEDEKGRILPECKHVFHVGCIDVWLMAHSTCPMCRAPVRMNGTLSAVGDGGPVVITTVPAGEEEVAQDEQRSMNGELAVEVETEEMNEVLVQVPVNEITGQCVKGDEPSSSSSANSNTSCSVSTSLGCSLKRLLSKSRSENRVVPSALLA